VGQVTCVVTTEDGATLYVYITTYAAILYKGKSERTSRLNPAMLIAVSPRSVILQQKKSRHYKVRMLDAYTSLAV